MYYFDHSATTPLHPDVVELMHDIQRYKFGNPSSTHKKGREAKLIIENTRNQNAKNGRFAAISDILIFPHILIVGFLFS